MQIKRKKAPFFIKKNDYKGMKIEINCTGSDTIKAFEDAGLKYYNEIILVNVAGGKAYTAGHDAKLSRKIAKVHQNILCFFKTDEQEETKIHEQILIFLKGDSKAACNDLGEFVADNCVLPALQDDDGEYMA